MRTLTVAFCRSAVGMTVRTLPGKITVRIGVENGIDALILFDLGNVGFADIHFDFVGVKVDDGGDAGARKAAARRNGRDHFANLGVFGNRNAGEGGA